MQLTVPRQLWAVLAAALAMLIVLAGPAAAAGEAVFGLLKNREGPVAGATITVSSADGSFSASATTAEDGTWRIELPGFGDFSALLETDTLPEDVSIRDEDRNPLEFTLREAQTKPILFALGEGRVNTSNQWLTALQLGVDGIKFGLVIAMMAIGLSLIFGTTGLVNFAHGELVTLGALIAWFLNNIVGLHLIPAAVLAVLLGGIAGMAQDKLLWAPLRRRGTGLIAMLVVSIGLSIFLRYVFVYLFDGRTRPYAQYQGQTAISIGPIDITPKNLFAIGLSLVTLLAVAWMLQKTKVGKAMRAVADEKDLAESSGIDVERVILYTWGLGGALATMGGVLHGLTEQVSWQMGFQLLLLMFAGVTLGGLGTAYGALVGSLIIGIFIQVSTVFVSPELKNVGALLIMIIILLVRPQGILGKKQRVG